jgi:predicted O-methyltransferase YrrM
LPDWNLYGFDSFEGLPEQWRIGFPKGAFNLNGSLPSVHKSVTLVKGWFDETIPLWMNSNKSYSYIDILHIDCDLYSSTKTIFDNLHSMINQKTIIVFDELINYPTFKNHEIKALYEYLQKHNLDIDILCSKGENVALKIK